MNIKSNFKRASTLLLFVLLIVLFPNAIASSKAFHEDFNAINQAAKSVLMLEVYDKNGEIFKTGSGFVIFNNLTLVTNYHVMEDSSLIKAYSDDGYYYIINKVIAADKDKDIAILNFESPTNLYPLEYAENSELLRGQPIVAIGSPKGIKNTVSIGNISTLLIDNASTIIQFTAPISHGSSGGALFNDEGKVIGITSAILDEGQNINFAVDIDDAVLLYSMRKGEPIAIGEYEATAINTSPTTNSPQPTSTPSPKPIVKLTPKPTSRISALTGKQTGPNSIEISWKENSSGNFTYYISYGFADNPYWYNEQISKTSFIAEYLVPGYEYTFHVSTNKDFSSPLTVNIKVNEAESYTTRNFKAKSTSIYYFNTGEDVFEAKRTKMNSCKVADLERAGITRDYIIVMPFSISASNQNSPLETLVTLTIPNGDVYSYGYDGELISDSFSNFAYPIEINYLLFECLKWEGGYPKGTYVVKIYFNGQFASKASFKVK